MADVAYVVQRCGFVAAIRRALTQFRPENKSNLQDDILEVSQ